MVVQVSVESISGVFSVGRMFLSTRCMVAVWIRIRRGYWADIRIISSHRYIPLAAPDGARSERSMGSRTIEKRQTHHFYSLTHMQLKNSRQPSTPIEFLTASTSNKASGSRLLLSWLLRPQNRFYLRSQECSIHTQCETKYQTSHDDWRSISLTSWVYVQDLQPRYHFRSVSIGGHSPPVPVPPVVVACLGENMFGRLSLARTLSSCTSPVMRRQVNQV